jgi:hypothetical protein
MIDGIVLIPISLVIAVIAGEGIAGRALDLVAVATAPGPARPGGRHGGDVAAPAGDVATGWGP